MPKDPQRDALIARLELEAREDPAGYRRRTALLAGFGYAYIAVVLILTLALLWVVAAVLVWSRNPGLGIQLVIALAVFAFVLLRSLWVRFPAPEGIALDPYEFHALRRAVEEIRAAAQAPRVHEMLLTGDLNAGVVQVPRLGLLGWPRNYLLLGLPLLDGLAPEEARAVLAHEFGHLSRADGALGGWIYRTRAAWAHLAEELRHEKHPGTAVLGWFFVRYQPYFDAYSFVAARAQERLADALGARVAGSRAMADALSRLPVLTESLEGKFWPALHAKAATSPEPVGSPFHELPTTLSTALETGEAQATLALALAVPTSHDDTHPCLRERLETLGETPRTPPPPRTTAAQELLGAARGYLAAELDRQWASAVRRGWSDHFESTQRVAKRLARYDSGELPRVASAAKALEYALLREQVSGAQAALPELRAALAAYPGDLDLRLQLARVLLDVGQEELLETLAPLFDAKPEAAAAAHWLACEYFRRRGRADEARSHFEAAL